MAKKKALQADEIINTIDQIYKQCSIPKNLQIHMQKVAAVGEILCEKWEGTPTPNKPLIIAALLLHDMANIIKYDLVTPEGIKILGPDRKRVEELRTLQQEFKEKYGPDERKANIAILKELNIDKEIIDLVKNLELENALEIQNSQDINAKIGMYADMRVGPNSILMLKERFADIKHRYKERIHKEFKNFEQLEYALYKIEGQLLEHAPISPEEINDFSVSLIADKHDAGL